MAIAGGCEAIQNRGKTKNIIFLVSDGMSSGTLQMADTMLRRRDGHPSYGPGSEAIGGFVRNTQLFDVIVELVGVEEYSEKHL